MGRWDHLFEAKPRPIVEQVLDEVANLVARDLLTWPPPIQGWESDAEAKRFAPLFAPGAPRPGKAVFREAFRLARWEMDRAIEAIDDYVRHERWREAEVAPDGHLALQFLYRWLTEQMLGLAEATESHLRRPQLRDCLERCEKRFAEVTAPRAEGPDGSA